MNYDTVDAHLPAAGALHRAVLPMAWYLAWCAQHQLLSDVAVQAAGDSLLRLRYREISPGEFFVPLAAGELEASLFSSAGQQFTEQHYAAFLEHVNALFGEALYRQQDNWDTYALVAPFLSARLHGKTRATNKEQEGRWWKFWK